MAVHIMGATTTTTTDMLGAVPDSSAIDDMGKKIRKPYTITKSRESWTEQEHDKFLEALQLFDRDWKKIEAFIGTKTVIQIRSHAQKYFLKVQKNGTGEHVPPPRPKRKSAQPYPQKATKPGAPAWVHHMALPGDVGFTKKGLSPVAIASPKTQTDQEEISLNHPQHLLPGSQVNGDIVPRAMPDFTEVYTFLGSVFDPSTDGHLEKMQEMTPIDCETVLLLMRNLSINLSCGS